AFVFGTALLCCVPWTARNCVRMHRCALVSVNAGWNLFIGEETESGAWEEVRFPEECRAVWDEAQKDVCLERVARRNIRASTVAWLARMPKKLAVTFDYFGAGPWYLHVSNPSAFSDSAKLALGAVETIVSRFLLVGALVVLALRAGLWRKGRIALGVVGVVAALAPPTWFGSVGWVAYVVLAAQAALAHVDAEARARQAHEDGGNGLLLGWTAAVIAATAVTHAVFFGAGRYGLVVVPFVTAICALKTRR
ncbi:MAG TPA: hypothetical protein VNO21_22450, partial [Polyangiaceae bacterium]|nr:hypothetical protein [Polyangiaceae bacterium]